MQSVLKLIRVEEEWEQRVRGLAETREIFGPSFSSMHHCGFLINDWLLEYFPASLWGQSFMLFFFFFFFCKKIGQDTEHASQIHLAGILVLPRGGLSIRRTVLFSYQFYRVLANTVPFVSFYHSPIHPSIYPWLRTAVTQTTYFF